MASVHQHRSMPPYAARRRRDGGQKPLLFTRSLAPAIDYHDLRHAVFQLRDRYPSATLLVEDKGSGTSLIQELRAKDVAVIGINPQGDKLTRAVKISAKFEAGAVFFPKAAPWLGPLKAELLGFPNVKHDDQVDSVTQALSWISLYRHNRIPIVSPIIVSRPHSTASSCLTIKLLARDFRRFQLAPLSLRLALACKI